MPGYTIKNLRELTDSAADSSLGIAARFARGPLETDHLGVSLLNYQPGVRSPMAHTHREQEEVYVVLAGSGRIRLGDEVCELRPWDAVRVSPETVRAFEADGSGMEILAIGSDRPEGGDGERAADTWIAEGETAGA